MGMKPTYDLIVLNGKFKDVKSATNELSWITGTIYGITKQGSDNYSLNIEGKDAFYNILGKISTNDFLQLLISVSMLKSLSNVTIKISPCTKDSRWSDIDVFDLKGNLMSRQSWYKTRDAKGFKRGSAGNRDACIIELIPAIKKMIESNPVQTMNQETILNKDTELERKSSTVDQMLEMFGNDETENDSVEDMFKPIPKSPLTTKMKVLVELLSKELKDSSYGKEFRILIGAYSYATFNEITEK